MPQLKIGIAGFGNVGQEIARRLVSGAIADMELAAITSHDLAKTRQAAATVAPGVDVVDLQTLCERCEIVVETATGSAVPEIVRAALGKGRQVVCISAAGLLGLPEAEDLARRSGGRVIIASGAQPAFDVLRAASEEVVHSVHLTSRIKPESLFGEPYALERDMDFKANPPTGEMLVFSGTAREAAAHFPRHMNIAVSISFAGIGLDLTTLELWVDPQATGARNTLEIRSDAAIVTTTIQNIPSRVNTKTSAIVAPSIMAALRRLVLPIVAGS